MEPLKKRHKDEIEKFNSFNKDHQKYIDIKKQLGGQLNEVESVHEELKLLNTDNTVYKAIGPVLVKQDLKEAKETVAKRRNYINDQIKRNDDLIKEIENKRKVHEDNIKKTENQIQQLQLKAAMKA